MGAWEGAWGHSSYKVEELIEVDDHRLVVVVRERHIGKGSGLRVESQFGSVDEFRDGKLVRWEVHAQQRRRPRSRRPESVTARHEYAEWQVRVRASNRDQVAMIADTLGRAGIRSVRRWGSVVIGARTEEQAQALAQRVRDLLVPGVAAVEVGRVSKLWLVLQALGEGGADFGGF